MKFVKSLVQFGLMSVSVMAGSAVIADATFEKTTNFINKIREKRAKKKKEEESIET